MPSLNITSAQSFVGARAGPDPNLDPSWFGTGDHAAPSGGTSPQVIVLAVVCSAIGTALLAFALAKLWQQHRGGGSPRPVDRSEFVPPPPPYSLDPPPPVPEVVVPAMVANHVQATTHHGAYHHEVSEREEEEIELLELPRRREEGEAGGGGPVVGLAGALPRPGGLS
ncbi:hypothetical protein QBC37DRAFT_407114 [Rhypophila decipiens]|uniref:Uncharacterized protein n=1 Tax=Rhypophila decipiens TaxID=261697 RepID=A0AAN6XVG2_9PEZI|nr:hypothetical protein QBC37DRAFT_407114 [Rhypophila decipiens]